MSNEQLIKILIEKENRLDNNLQDGKISQRLYDSELSFLQAVAGLIEQNKAYELKENLGSEQFIRSLIRELDFFDLRFVMTLHNEIRLFKKDFTAYQ